MSLLGAGAVFGELGQSFDRVESGVRENVLFFSLFDFGYFD